MEEVQSLTEDLRLMIHFDPETLTGMQTAEALLQLLLDIARVEKPYRGAKGVLHSRFPKVVLALFALISLLTCLDQWIRLICRKALSPPEVQCSRYMREG